MPAKKLCIHKNVKRKAKAMSIQNTIIVIIFFDLVYMSKA